MRWQSKRFNEWSHHYYKWSEMSVRWGYYDIWPMLHMMKFGTGTFCCMTYSQQIMLVSSLLVWENHHDNVPDVVGCSSYIGSSFCFNTPPPSTIPTTPPRPGIPTTTSSSPLPLPQPHRHRYPYYNLTVAMPLLIHILWRWLYYKRNTLAVHNSIIFRSVFTAHFTIRVILCHCFTIVATSKTSSSFA